ncbi:MAG: hypothetical protein HHAS10_05260 [Candidatus Altimarinota bacterium]
MSIDSLSPSLKLAHNSPAPLETQEISIIVNDILEFGDGTLVLSGERVDDMLEEEEEYFICDTGLFEGTNLSIGSWMTIRVTSNANTGVHRALSIADRIDDSILGELF